MENFGFWDGVITVLVLQGFAYYGWKLYLRHARLKETRNLTIPPAPRQPAPPKDFEQK